MLTLVVPNSLKSLVLGQLPEALVIGAEETEDGVISALPDDWTGTTYDAIACGPGMTPGISPVMTAILRHPAPLLLDADALNWCAAQPALAGLGHRVAPTLLTPHLGEFRRLFPKIFATATDPMAASRSAAQGTPCTLILKGANSVITSPTGQQWIMSDSTPALARGGSGDVLTGLIGGINGPAYKASGAVSNTSRAFSRHLSGLVACHSGTGYSPDTDRTGL